MIVVIGDNMTAQNEVVQMALVDVKSLIYNEEKVNQAINTKEEAEILNGLFQGNHIYETFATERALRLSKIIDMF